MKIPLEFYDILRNRINISDVIRQKISLVRKSGGYVGLCPFHQEKTPSFTVNDSKKFYYCFGCKTHGDVIKFISDIEGLSYKDSAIKLANSYGIEIPKLTQEQEKLYEESEQIFNILALATELFQSELNSASVSYLESRGIDRQTIENFSIGYAPSGKLLKFFEKKAIPLMKLAAAGLIGKKEDDAIYEIFHNRIIFPIKNVYNKVVGFGGRAINNGLPKYLNSPETIVFKKSETLYGENTALSAARKRNYVILVEGYIDVIALHKAGFHETVASLGTAVTERHLQKLWNSCDEIIFCMDGDDAGLMASKKAANNVLPLISNNKKVSFIKLPQNLDPDDVINNHGQEYFKQILDNRKSLSQMIWDLEYKNKLFTTAETRAELESKLDEYCNKLNDGVLKKNYKQFFKDQIWKNVIRKKNTAHNVELQAPYVNNYSEIELLEQALLCTTIKFSKILKSEEIKNQTLSINFKNKNLGYLRDLIIENCHTVEENNEEIIKELAKKTGLHDTFLLTLNVNSLCFDVLNTHDVTPEYIWKFLYKKYYLVMLKQEYACMIHNELDNSFEKAVIYQQEILKISQELQKLNESFIK